MDKQQPVFYIETTSSCYHITNINDVSTTPGFFQTFGSTQDECHQGTTTETTYGYGIPTNNVINVNNGDHDTNEFSKFPKTISALDSPFSWQARANDDIYTDHDPEARNNDAVLQTQTTNITGCTEKGNTFETIQTTTISNIAARLVQGQGSDVLHSTSINQGLGKEQEVLKAPQRVAVQDVLIVLAGFIVFLFPQGLGNSYGVVYSHLKVMENLTDYQVSWVGSLMSGMNGIGAPLGSQLIAVVGCRWTSLLGGVLILTGVVISAFVSNINVLYLSLGALPGVGTAISQLAAIVSITGHFNRGRPVAMGIISTGGAVGMLVFPLLWSLVLESFEWRDALLVIAGLTASIVLSSLQLKPREKVEVGEYKQFPRKKKREGSSPSYLSFFKLPSFLLLVISTFLGGLSIFIFGSYIPEYARNRLPELSATEIAVIVCAMGAGSFVGRILFGSLSMTSPKAPLIIHASSLALCGVSNGLVPFSDSYILLIFNSALQGCFLGGWTTVCPLVAANLFGAEALSKSLGLAYLFMGFGCVAGPPIASVLEAMTNKVEVLFFFAAAGYIIGAIFLLPLFKAKAKVLKDNEIEVPEKQIQSRGNINPSFAEGG